MSDSEEELPHKKKIKVAAASLIDLKAELAKKREQFNRQKLQNVPRVRPPKPQEVKNKGVDERNQRDLESQLDKDELDESRKALERKTRLYEQLKSNALKNEDEETPFLVDFEQKAVNEIQEERRELELEQERKQESSESDLEEFEDDPKDPSEDWVEFVDALGRSRVCLRRDLPHYKKIDDRLKELPKPKVVEREFQQVRTILKEPKIDAHHERLKEKWSKTEEDTKNAAHVHYENIRFDEIRNHGTGFFQFSTDEQTRNEQRRILDELRDKTVQQRKKSQILRLRRKSVMKERLKRVRRRKRIRMGLDPEESEEDSSSDSDKDPLEIPVREIQLPEPEKENPIREWDIGKTPMGLEQVWAQKKEVLRGEREPEFAPPSFY